MHFPLNLQYRSERPPPHRLHQHDAECDLMLLADGPPHSTVRTILTHTVSLNHYQTQSLNVVTTNAWPRKPTGLPAGRDIRRWQIVGGYSILCMCLSLIGRPHAMMNASNALTHMGPNRLKQTYSTTCIYCHSFSFEACGTHFAYYWFTETWPYCVDSV